MFQMAMKRQIYLNGSIARKIECLPKNPRPLKGSTCSDSQSFFVFINEKTPEKPKMYSPLGVGGS